MPAQLAYQSASQTPARAPYFKFISPPAFFQKVSCKQLRGSFINVCCLLCTKALLLLLLLPPRLLRGVEMSEMLQAPNPATFVSLLPGASGDEKWKSAVSHIPSRGEAPQGEWRPSL